MVHAVAYNSVMPTMPIGIESENLRIRKTYKFFVAHKIRHDIYHNAQYTRR